MEPTPAKLVWKDIIGPQPPPESLLDPLTLGLIALTVFLVVALAWWRWRRPQARARMQLRRLYYQLGAGRLAPRAAAQTTFRHICAGLRQTHLGSYTPPQRQRAEWLAFRAALLQACYAAPEPEQRTVMRLCSAARDWLRTGKAAR
ncbi:MAG: hypothetical protein AMS22_04745 [Thiotrichales bacterium SG8_50]|nr:MAG: hypothetical protein AMS22_04745 [Thiotrichales bacterium SG8_50]